MTASSSCSGSADNFWSRDDIRVHTFGVHPKAVEVLAEGSVRGKPTRTAILIGRAFVDRLHPLIIAPSPNSDSSWNACDGSFRC